MYVRIRMIYICIRTNQWHRTVSTIHIKSFSTLQSDFCTNITNHYTYQIMAWHTKHLALDSWLYTRTVQKSDWTVRGTNYEHISYYYTVVVNLNYLFYKMILLSRLGEVIRKCSNITVWWWDPELYALWS